MDRGCWYGFIWHVHQIYVDLQQPGVVLVPFSLFVMSVRDTLTVLSDSENPKKI